MKTKPLGRIVNLTQHTGTPEQGVVELPPEVRKEVVDLITFGEIPTGTEMRRRAQRISTIAADHGANSAMLGGAPYFQRLLEEELREKGIEPVYAFSVREAVEQQLPDGSVRKTSVFRHAGFVRPYL